MRFVEFSEVQSWLRGKTVAVVGSAPSCAENEPNFVDLHDLVCRVNNYKPGLGQGFRCDIHYSFYGSSVTKDKADLCRDGVKLCMCKCPNSRPLKCEWHVRHGKVYGIDFRYIYERRASWWWCDTYVPSEERFLEKIELLGGHIPTTGFAAILDLLACEPQSLYVTGFDFFSSRMHNVNEPWRPGNPEDPIGHRPELELAWIAAHRGVMRFDRKLETMLGGA